MVIDASVWVAAFLKKDAHHLASINFLQRLVSANYLVELPNLALAEVGGAVARQTQDSAAARAAVEFLQNQSWIRCHETSPRLAALAAEIAVSCFLRGADATYVALASHLQAPLVTLDQEMLSRAVSIVATVTPADWLQNHLAKP